MAWGPHPQDAGDYGQLRWSLKLPYSARVALTLGCAPEDAAACCVYVSCEGKCPECPSQPPWWLSHSAAPNLTTMSKKTHSSRARRGRSLLLSSHCVEALRVPCTVASHGQSRPPGTHPGSYMLMVSHLILARSKPPKDNRLQAGPVKPRCSAHLLNYRLFVQFMVDIKITWGIATGVSTMSMPLKPVLRAVPEPLQSSRHLPQTSHARCWPVANPFSTPDHEISADK